VDRPATSALHLASSSLLGPNAVTPAGHVARDLCFNAIGGLFNARHLRRVRSNARMTTFGMLWRWQSGPLPTQVAAVLLVLAASALARSHGSFIGTDAGRAGQDAKASTAEPNAAATRRRRAVLVKWLSSQRRRAAELGSFAAGGMLRG